MIDEGFAAIILEKAFFRGQTSIGQGKKEIVRKNRKKDKKTKIKCVWNIMNMMSLERALKILNAFDPL